MIIALAFLCSISHISASASDVKALPTIISFGGTGPVIIRVKGMRTEAKPGSILQYGSKIETGPDNSVTIQYPDGTLMAIHSGTIVEIKEQTQKMQWNEVHTGQIRALVNTEKIIKQAQKRPKFLIKTKSAVLGVRGTDFVVSVDPTGMNTKVHTLDGIVDVAPNEGSLLDGSAAEVKEGYSIEATEKGLTQAKAFDKDDFLKTVEDTPHIGDIPGGTGGKNRSGDSDKTSKKSEDRSRNTSDNNERDKNDKKESGEQRPADKRAEQSNRADKNQRKLDLLSFRIGAMFAFNSDAVARLTPYDTNGPIRAISLSWNPALPIPITGILWLKGHFGYSACRNGSLNNQLVVREAQLFLSATVMQRFFGEVGFGRQSWTHDGPRAGLFTFNAGFMFPQGDKKHLLNSVFIGRSLLLVEPRIEEFKVGIGVGF
ncbi:MAG: FecR family protein [Bdellovibrionota bacterium]